MDKVHKEALRKTRSKIVRDLNIESEIWDLLQERNIFTPIMLEYIQAERTKTAKVRKLLDDLIRRGPKAYHEFIHCLRESRHGHIADEILKSEQEVRRGSSEIPCSQPVVITTSSEASRGELSISATSGGVPCATASYISGGVPNASVISGGLPCASGISGGVQTASDVSVVRETQPSRQSTEYMDVSDAVPTPEDGVNNAYPASTSRPVGTSRPIAQPEDDDHLVATVGLSDVSSRPPGVYQQVDPRRRYKMDSDPRGLCVIINNRRFERMDEREGTDKNRDDLKQLFNELGFQVSVHDDQKAEDMKSLIVELAIYEGLSVVDAVAVILLSHGDNHVIYGTDGLPLDLHDDIFTPFARSANKAINKPKFFIINACRGGLDDSGVNQDGLRELTSDMPPCVINGDVINPDAINPDVINPDAVGILPIYSTDGNRIPTLQDIYIAYSTFGGYASYRTDDGGSKFIEIMVEVFREEAATSDINTMMTEVNRRMAAWGLVNQIPSPTYTLTKALYFNPPAKTWSYPV